MNYCLKTTFLSYFKALSANPIKWSNTLKQFVGNSRRIVERVWPFCGVDAKGLNLYQHQRKSGHKLRKKYIFKFSRLYGQPWQNFRPFDHLWQIWQWLICKFITSFTTSCYYVIPFTTWRGSQTFLQN